MKHWREYTDRKSGSSRRRSSPRTPVSLCPPQILS